MENRLSSKTKFFSGFADLGGNTFFAVINFWLMYYLTDMVGLSSAVAGITIMVGKIWDAVTDPMMGYVSDNSKFRWGKSKPFMVIGLAPLFVSVIALFTKVNFSSEVGLAIYYTAIYCLVNTFYTVVFIPYYSLLSGLTNDYNERTSLQSYRMIFAIIGQIIGSVLAKPIIGFFPDQVTGFTWMGVIFGAVIAVAVLTTVFMVKSSANNVLVKEHKEKGNYFKENLSVLKSRPYMIVIAAMITCFISLVITSTTVPYFYKYYLNAEDMASVGILVSAVSNIAFVPVVLKLSKRYDKKKTWLIGLVVAAMGSLALYTIAPYGIPWVFIPMVVTGAGACSTYVLLMSIVSDCVDYEYLKSGKRKDGSFMGFMTFGQKLGMALGAAAVGWVLSGLGYIADAAQTPIVLSGMRILAGIVPASLCLIAFFIILFYPITAQKHAEIIKQIELNEKEGVQA